MDRPGLDCFKKRVSDFNNGITNIRIRKLIVPRIDRLGRTLLGTLQFIQDYIVEKDTARTTSVINNNRYLIEFVSCQERFLKIVTNENGVIEPASQLVLTMFSCFAEFDRNQIVDKLRDGRLKRVAAGYPLGGGNKPYGYTYVKGKDGYGNYEEVPEEKAKFYEVRRLFVEEHLSPAVIADRLGLSTEQLVINMMKRRTYMGLIEYQGKEYPGRFPKFITEEQWEEQQTEFSKRSKSRSDAVYMLTGLIFCGNCGAKMRYQKDPNGTLRLVCYSKDKSVSKQKLVKDPNCPNKTRYKATDIESIVIGELLRISYMNNSKNKKSVTETDVIAGLEKEILRQQSALKKMTMKYALCEDGSAQSAAYEEIIAELSSKIDSLITEMNSEKNKRNITKKIEAARIKIDNLKDAWQFMSDREKRETCRELIEKIIVTYNKDGNPDIELHLQLEQYLNMK